MAQPTKIHLPEEQLNQYYKLHAEDERLGEQLGKFSAQLDHELRVRRTKYITRHEIRKINPETPVYLSCGKAFILDSVPTTIQTLKKDLQKSDKTILTIKKTGIHIQGQQDHIRRQVNELIKPYIGK